MRDTRLGLLTRARELGLRVHVVRLDRTTRYTFIAASGHDLYGARSLREAWAWLRGYQTGRETR